MRVRAGLRCAAAAVMALALGHAAARAQDESGSGYPAPPTAPANAPNVLIIMTDDVGFAASSTFG